MVVQKELRPVRFGDLYVVSMRLAVGIQGATFDSSFTPGGVVMDGPGRPFEFDFVWSFG